MKINREIICLPLLAVFLIMITGTAIAEEVNVELVSHLGGVVSDVVVEGNYAYIGQGQGLVVLDISDESNPSEVGRVITSSMVNGVAVAGNCVYLLENGDSLVIVDITNPSSPKLAGRYDYDASSIVVAGDYLYLGVYNGFDILDITNPFSPRNVGEYRYYTYPATYGNVAAVSGNYAYVALNYYNEDSDFMIVDISNPSSPTLAGSYNAYNVCGVAISGNYAYITDSYDGLVVLDISNSSSPTFVSSYSTGFYGYESDVAVSDNYAYIADGGNGLTIVDVIDPSSPKPVSSYNTGYATEVVVAGNYAYVINTDNGLVVVDITNPSTPTLAGSYNNIVEARDIFVENNYAYVIDTGNGLVSVDIINPYSPKTLGRYQIENPTNRAFTNKIAVSGNYAYLADQYNSLEIVDITNPSSPRFVGDCDVGAAFDVALASNYAYVADLNGNLVIVDITNPLSPRVIGRYNTGNIAVGVDVVDNYAYVALRDSGLVIVDVTTPSSPELVGSYNTGYYGGSTFDLAVADNYVYLANISNGRSGLSVIDVTNPSAPTLAGNLDGVFATRIDISGNYAYIASYNSGLFIVDITNPSSPTVIGHYDTAGTTFDSSLKENYTYVADGNNGLVVLKADIPKQVPITVGQGASTPNITQKFIEAYNRSGGLSVLGNPTTEVHSAFGFEVQDFPEMPVTDGGVIMYNPNNNTAYFIHGAIWDKYYAYVDKARLGAVASDEGEAAIQPGKTTGRYTKFETGTIHWISDENLDHPQRGESFVTYGNLDKVYTDLGGTYSDLGFPIMDQKTKEDGHGYCEFEGGNISWDDSTGTYKVKYPATNTPPTTNPVSVTNTNSLTPTISWTYSDADNDPQQQYELEVCTDPWGTGTKMWSQSQSSMYSSVDYGGDTLASGETYYVRLRAFDGTDWGDWSETSFILLSEEDNEPPQILFWNSPADYSTVYDSPALVSGTVTDPSGVKSIFINGKDVTSPFGGTSTTMSFSDYIYLNEGQNTISITATDNSEKQNSGVIKTINVNFIFGSVDSRFRPNPNGYWFVNEGTGEHTTSDFHNTYGYSVDLKNTNSRTTAFYNGHFKDMSTDGNCFGMSSTSLLLYKNGIYNTINYQKTDAVLDAWSTFQPITYDSCPVYVISWIVYYQPLQHDKECLEDKSAYQNLNAYNELKRRLTNGWTDDPMVLELFWNGGGHAVVPYKIEESSDHKSADIYVYDNNHPYDQNNPDDSKRHLHVDLNPWKIYDYGGWKNIDTIDLISLKAFNEPAELPYWATDLSSSNTAHLLYTDTSGQKLGYDHGEYKNEIQGSCPMIICNDESAYDSKESYYVPNPSIKMELYGTGNGNSETSMMTPKGLIIAYVPLTPISVDEFKVLNNGTGIYFKSGNDTTSSLGLMLDVETPDHAQIVNASISHIELGGSINLSNDNGNIIIKNNGLPRTCNLQLEQIGSNPNSDDSIKNIVIEEDSTVFIKPSNWNDIANSQITIEHDIGSDGSIDSIEIVRPIEAEVTFDPETFNLNSTGEWVTAYIELPAGYNVSDIDINSVLMNGTVLAISDPKYDFVTNESEYLTDLDLDGIQERMFKFNHGDVARILKVGDKVTVTFTGKVKYDNGVSSGLASFEGNDIVRVIDSKNKKG